MPAGKPIQTNPMNDRPPDIDEDLACPQCGYNLRGLMSGACPECGTRVDFDALRKLRDEWTYSAWKDPLLRLCVIAGFFAATAAAMVAQMQQLGRVEGVSTLLAVTLGGVLVSSMFPPACGGTFAIGLTAGILFIFGLRAKESHRSGILMYVAIMLFAAWWAFLSWAVYFMFDD